MDFYLFLFYILICVSVAAVCWNSGRNYNLFDMMVQYGLINEEYSRHQKYLQVTIAAIATAILVLCIFMIFGI